MHAILPAEFHFARQAARCAGFGRRGPVFESLESRQMLNAAPVANNDTFAVAEDTTLFVPGEYPTGVFPVKWEQNGHYYGFVRKPFSWHDANSDAQSLIYYGSQGHLVTFESVEEHTFVTGNITGGSSGWIGLTDQGLEGNFRWIDGESPTFTNWAPGQPDNNQNQEHYVAINLASSAKYWSDASDSFATDGYIVEFEGPLHDSVLDNDTDADSVVLIAELVSGPQHGTVTFNANGTFAYSPTADFVGADSFTYKVSDGNADSNVATVSIAVKQVDDAPIAAIDHYAAAENHTLSVLAAQGVLANDSDLEDDPLTAVLVNGAVHGQVTLNNDGSFTYVPAVDYYGRDSFTYRASDGNLQTEPVTVGLVVTSPRDAAPIAQDDSAVVIEDNSTVVQTIALPTADLIYDASSGQVFASVGDRGHEGEYHNAD